MGGKQYVSCIKYVRKRVVKMFPVIYEATSNKQQVPSECVPTFKNPIPSGSCLGLQVLRVRKHRNTLGRKPSALKKDSLME